MQTFIMLTRLSPEAVRHPKAYETLERAAMSAIQEQCPQVRWLHSWAVLGPHDYLDVFAAPDIETAARVAALVRLAGHAQTEVWGAVEWPAFRDMVRALPEAGELITA
jgi:uncharacterized protein with GYD domain